MGLVHLVLGDVAAGVLRDAMAQAVVAPAECIRFRDVLALGPLGALDSPQGPASRAAYWAQLLPEARPGVADFEEEEARYRAARAAAERGETLMAWAGDHASSQLWLQRLCSQLPAQAGLLLVDVAHRPGPRRRALGQFEPRELAGLLEHARRLSPGEIESLARAWHNNARAASGVRCWERSAGHISHHPDARYDALLLAQCDADWQLAAQVVGSAQWECDEYLGDVFFAWRLRELARAGDVELQGGANDAARARVRTIRGA